VYACAAKRLDNFGAMSTLKIFELLKGGLSLRIHVWGGLGSQLHAVFLSERLKTHFPKKRIILVFHSSGVTRRLPESIPLLSDIEHKFVDDYVKADIKVKSTKGLRRLTRQSLLTRFHFIEDCNNESDYTRIRWWTLQTRGHYSRLSLNAEFSMRIFSRMSSQVTINNDELDQLHQAASIHLRLGDLLEIQSKNPTNFEDILKLINLIFAEVPAKALLIFSDSPEVATNILKEIRFATAAREDFQASALKSIFAMVQSSIFIGTGSKLSIWVAVLRTHIYPLQETYLPSYLRPIIESLIPNLVEFKNLKFYYSVDKR